MCADVCRWSDPLILHLQCTMSFRLQGVMGTMKTHINGLPLKINFMMIWSNIYWGTTSLTASLDQPGPLYSTPVNSAWTHTGCIGFSGDPVSERKTRINMSKETFQTSNDSLVDTGGNVFILQPIVRGVSASDAKNEIKPWLNSVNSNSRQVLS